MDHLSLAARVRKVAVNRAYSPAVVVGDGPPVPYADLLVLAEGLEGRLRDAQPFGGVAVSTRSPTTFVSAVLAARLSGRWHVPLDPLQPPGRAARLTARAGCSVLVRDDGTGTPEVVAVDTTIGPQRPPIRATQDYRPSNLEYVVFTSGSTGEPKPAAADALSFRSLVEWFQGWVGLGPDDRFLVVSSPAFDLTQIVTWATLLSGGCLTFPKSWPVLDPRAVEAVTRAWNPTLLFSTPTSFFAVAETRPGWGSGLSRVVFGGEKLDPHRLGRWLRASTGRHRTLNAYGPSECTVMVAAGDVSDGTVSPLVAVCDAELYVVGPSWAEVAPGVTGELWIGGSPVGPGYLDNPGLTAEAFVPCLRRQGAVAYRTGDLASADAHGRVTILGRASVRDVKIDGVRVDLNEVDEALSELPGVLGAAAFAARDADGAACIAAWVHTDQAMTSTAVRRDLLRRLPRSHVPRGVYLASEAPSTPGGKLDTRQAVMTAAEALNLTAERGIDDEAAAHDLFDVVVNASGRVAVWPHGPRLPEGWTTARSSLDHVGAREAVTALTASSGPARRNDDC